METINGGARRVKQREAVCSSFCRDVGSELGSGNDPRWLKPAADSPIGPVECLSLSIIGAIWF